MPLYSVRKGKVVENQTVLSDLKYTKVSPTSFIEILRLTNLETESSKQRTQHRHKWYTMSLIPGRPVTAEEHHRKILKKVSA